MAQRIYLGLLLTLVCVMKVLIRKSKKELMSYLTKVITLSVVFDKLRAMLFFCAIIILGDNNVRRNKEIFDS